MGIDILHHVGLVSSNFNATIERYERLGFTFTPLSMPRLAHRPGGEPEPIGAGNRHAIFRENYLEVLGIFDRARWDAFPPEQRGPYDLDRPLSRYEGMHVMHFGTDEIEAVRERLLREGVACSEISSFQRLVDTPDGPQMMRALTLHFPNGANPEGLVQIAQHLTPELVLQPRYMAHRNGAIGVTEAIACASDVGALSAKYERYSGCAAKVRGNLYVIELGRSRVVVISPDHLGEVVPGGRVPALPFLAGFTVATRDLAMTGQFLRDADVPFREHGGRLIVHPADACGSAVIFEEEGASR